MDAVLGLSVTPSAVGLVLMEGQAADGAPMDGEAVEIAPGRRSTPQQRADEAAAAVLRTEALAATRGQRLHAIGVTWSDDADFEASLLLQSLRECGFDNVIPVRLPEASEALAWGVAEVIGHDVTAVCVIESETVIALVVHTREGAVQTAVNHSIRTEGALVHWLSAIFTKADWWPEALVVVGSGVDLDAVMPRLEDALSVPVFAPTAADLALARGAALASAHSADVGFADATVGAGHRRSSGRRPMAQTGPLAMLVAGAVTFVVSVSVAVSMQLAPDRDAGPGEPTPAAKSSPEVAAVSDRLSEALPPVPAAPPEPIVPPAEVAPPPAEVAPPPAEPPAAPPVEVPADLPAAPPAESPAQPPVVAADVAPPPLQPPAPVPGAPVLPPESLAPGLVPAEPTPVPQRRGFLQRIRDRLTPGDEAAVQQAPPPAPPAGQLPPPPPGEPVLPPPPPAPPPPM